jgi:Flp pilus assembly protein TadG
LVEFALVIPIFLVLVVAIAEFAFLLTVKTGITFASQDGTQYAAELGNATDADCYILQRIEADVQAPVDASRIQSVSIFWTNLTGANLGADTWNRSGTHLCNNGVTIPYTQMTNGYPAANRCNVVLATGCATGHTGVDWIGVTITYAYQWITPLPGMIGLGGSPPTFVETNTSRLEPIQ